MKFDQIMEKVDIKNVDSDFEYLIFNIDEEERIEYQYGHKWCRRNDDLHRADGPAIEYEDGDKSWFLNGLRHRADGPACEYASGNKSWWLHGKDYSEKEFNEEVKNEI